MIISVCKIYIQPFLWNRKKHFILHCSTIMLHVTFLKIFHDALLLKSFLWHYVSLSYASENYRMLLPIWIIFGIIFQWGLWQISGDNLDILRQITLLLAPRRLYHSTRRVSVNWISSARVDIFEKKRTCISHLGSFGLIEEAFVFSVEIVSFDSQKKDTEPSFGQSDFQIWYTWVLFQMLTDEGFENRQSCPI